MKIVGECNKPSSTQSLMPKNKAITIHTCRYSKGVENIPSISASHLTRCTRRYVQTQEGKKVQATSATAGHLCMDWLLRCRPQKGVDSQGLHREWKHRWSAGPSRALRSAGWGTGRGARGVIVALDAAVTARPVILHLILLVMMVMVVVMVVVVVVLTRISPAATSGGRSGVSDDCRPPECSWL